jgi:dienelactone hydrolase
MRTLFGTTLPALLITVPAAGQVAPAAAPLAAFAYDATLPLNVRDSLRERIDGIEVRAVSYDSPQGGRVTGLLYLPPTPGRHPGMLVGHGAPGNSSVYPTMTTALAMARSGAVALTPDAPFARRGDDPLTLTPADSADLVQWMVDLRRGLDYLVARGDVDPARLGYIGNSFGGATGVLFAGVEPRLHAVVLRVADGGFVSHMSEPCDSAARGAAAVTGCLAWPGPLADAPADERDRWAAAMLPLEPIRFIGRTRAALLLQNGLQDPLVPPAKARRLKEAAPAGAEQRFYASGHRLPDAAMVEGLAFLHDHLGLAAPDSAFSAWLAARNAAAPPPARR